ncbi:UNVERIFIED_ORG: oligopeptide transport system permease protein [Methylobacterium sp. SuP10 SLI 274]|uniref:ABC transporter permease n=1 Tax=Methylorubrum extorquens TaxID=408 RepID=UPI00209EF83A|nr:ABC transporter permease [Methylorubrum extorquens]MDF9863329.1 oligopeptide transport system permease protein [Methylorubrum pseudosasae]MDH6636938.1 oligopeptide transport system permease protein [Methylobacterium sp. SuP10 SLI 274]MDH6666115.1 oligopeptide transport system permease protein [Methylorubrum zatmanii]MCP1558030.1 oligopeptide transport system permease protein [Methylorubrum extorquens]MDF9791639.1 oligopeptide transport system permease protein [Methylorubrum extorquens]
MSLALARRLARDRPALVALASLVLIALACFVGPQLTGHPPERIYPDFVRVAPSLAAHPLPDAVRPALTRLAFRMRLTLEDVAQDGDGVRMTLTAPKPIDARSLRLLPRSGLFGEARVLERSADGRRLVVEAPLRRLTFLLGTDALGRDLLSRCLAAGQVSLLIGLTAALAALLIGVAYGAVSGMAGGTVDALMMRLLDILYALPFVFFVIMLLVFFRAGLWLVLVAVAAVEWLDMARIVRTQTLSLKDRDFVRAASALGAGTGRILVRHIVPNTLGSIIAAATLLVPRVILLESFLSFLGLGVQEPDTSWGVLIAEGARALESAPWMLAAPACFLVVTLVALNRLGDGLGEALDPRLSAAEAR